MPYTCYLALNPDNIQNYHKAVIQADDDVIALSNAIHCVPLADMADGRKVCHFMFGTSNQNAAHLMVDPQYTFQDYAAALHISNSFLGETPEEVRANTGESFTKNIEYEDESGKLVTREIDLLKHEWR